jgi:hypothetical protein
LWLWAFIVIALVVCAGVTVLLLALLVAGQGLWAGQPRGQVALLVSFVLVPLFAQCCFQ